MVRFRYMIALGAGVALVGASHASTFTITKFYTSVSSGGNLVAGTPKVGEPYTVSVEWHQDGPGIKNYNLKFTMAGKTVTAEMKKLGPGDYGWAGQFGILALDDKIPASVQIDPEGKAGSAPGPTKSLTFTPTPPPAAIEHYDPVEIKGYQTATYDLNHASDYGIVLMMGEPATGGWQRLEDASGTVAVGSIAHNIAAESTSNAYRYPVYYYNGEHLSGGHVSFSQSFTLEVKAQRVNPGLLRKVTWQQLDAMKTDPNYKFFLQPEDVIQSSDKAIKNFVLDALGTGYRNRYTPYDAAREVFKAVVRRCYYWYPKDGEKDKRPATAVDMVNQGFGDCGGFSILLVACYRCLGFPARTTCGAWIGDDAGHCWCEMYFPGDGWMVSDGSAGDGNSKDGKYAYYFGCVPDLNARYAQERGNSFTKGPANTSWLQAPMWPPVVTGGASISNSTCHTHVEEISGSSETAAIRKMAPLQLPRWDISNTKVNGRFLVNKNKVVPAKSK